MRQIRSLDGEEWSCIACGHLDYGEGFVPLERVDDRISIGGVRL